MYEVLWWVTFGIFLAALPLSAALAIITVTVRKAGAVALPGWLIWFRRGVNVVIGLGWAGLTACIVGRWVEAGYPPFSNMPESLLWMAWGFCCVYFVSRIFTKFPAMEVVACIGVLAILAYSSRFDEAPRSLMPALDSNWLVFHVFTCMVSYGAFFAAFLTSILWLVLWRRGESRETVDVLSYQIMAFGFLLLTVGVISGAVWANEAWGRYWGWDPKETWSLITWFAYGGYLHFRLAAGSFGIRRERLPTVNAVFAVVGFAFTMFTYVGVNYIARFQGLHSYAQ